MSETLEATIKTTPANVEAEQAVLGSLLIDPDAIVKVSTTLRDVDFYREPHQWIFRALLALHERREPADFVTLVDEMERNEQLEEIGGPAYITQLINSTPTAIYVDHYARIVERTATLRRLIGAANQIAELAYDESHDVNEVVDRAEGIILGVSESRIHRDLTPVARVLDEVVDQIDFLARNQNRMMGVPTGFVLLDKMLGGFQKSDLIIVAGRPGMGKSSLGLSIAQNAARRYDARVAVFSLEMSSEQVVQRLLSIETAIDSHRLRMGQIDEEEWPILVEAANTLAGTNIFIDDTPSATVLEIRTKARRLYAERGIDLIVVDYMQLMSGGGGGSRGENRQQEISFISRSLKGLARELNKPVLSDLRESGCLSGETLVYLPELGLSYPIRELAKRQGFRIAALDQDVGGLVRAKVSNAFCTGTKPVFRITTNQGKSLRATANHRFLSERGWKRLDRLRVGERIAATDGNALPTVALESERFSGASSELHAGIAAGTASGGVEDLPAEAWGRQPFIVPGAGSLPVQASASRGETFARGVYWDRVDSIEADGIEEVYDLTVPIHHNFAANDIIVHNSIEQDADVVIFVYREDYYNEETEQQNIADLMVAKHRHGTTGTVSLYFRKELTQFRDLELRREDLDY